MKTDITIKVEIPEKVKVEVDKGIVFVKGPKGEVRKKLISQRVNISVQETNVIIETKKGTKREKKMIGTFKAHITNMIKGVLEGFVYKLKICSSHFPMTASLNGRKFSVKNFLGESVERSVEIKEGIDVKIEGNDILVESVDKEAAGQTAASIEKLCSINNRDRRIFQDGIWVIEKAGKKIE